MKLTRAQCDRFEAKNKSYKKFDGGGLFLEIMKNGNKLWRFKYRYQGKEKRISFGKYPIVTLVQARENRDQAKKLLNDGLDPSTIRKQQKSEAIRQSQNTFETVALEWHEKQLHRWGDKRGIVVLQRLEKNIFPFLGSRPINEIKPLDLLEVLKIMEDRNVWYTAKNVNSICSQIFKYAIIVGKCEINPTINLSSALKSRPTKHHRTIEAKEIKAFISALDRNDARLYAQTRRAVLFSMLTFVRPKEVRHARWQDIDFNEREWRIPAEFMKTRKPHLVPLANQTIEIILEQKEALASVNTDWVFPGKHSMKKPMSDATVNKAIRLLGFGDKMTAHGFRALARTTIREKLKYYPDVIEAQLAHKPMGALGGAYDRAQFLEERVLMMQDWADFVDRVYIKNALK